MTLDRTLDRVWYNGCISLWLFFLFLFTFYCLAHTHNKLYKHTTVLVTVIFETHSAFLCSICMKVFHPLHLTYTVKLFLHQQKLLFWLVLLQLAYLRGSLMETWKFAHCSKILSRSKVNSALAMLLDCQILSVIATCQTCHYCGSALRYT